MGVSKFPNLGLSRLWGLITLCEDLWLKWGLKKSFILRQEISNNMWHATFTQGSRVDSQLLVVGSQIANLTPSLSFGHNLCLKCPNESWEPILDIYVSIAFQWYKKLFNQLGFNPYNCPLNIREHTKTPTPKEGAPWECEGSFPHTLLHSRGHEMWFPGFLLGPHPSKPLPQLRAEG
jgi:hypothetical protein